MRGESGLCFEELGLLRAAMLNPAAAPLITSVRFAFIFILPVWLLYGVGAADPRPNVAFILAHTEAGSWPWTFLVETAGWLSGPGPEITSGNLFYFSAGKVNCCFCA